MSERSSIKDHVAIVTGGAAGIGEAVVLRFASEGAKVVIVDKDNEKGAAVAEKISAGGAEVIFVQADVTSSADVRSAFAQTMDRWGQLDILVNCAGGFFETHSIEEQDEDDWDAILAWNLKSVFLCAKEAAVVMKKRSYGRIVSISSLTGRTGIIETALHYGSAKAGILGFTRRLAVELAPNGITVNAVAPGVVLSPRVAEMHKDRLPEIYKTVPMARAGEAEEIADGIWYFSTPGSSYITGVTLDINGGRWMA
ncbi:MAG: SDR family oxidoreductase [Nitrospinaceae bacterium]|jgi:3-oxoacyl-[acyl-carrier protein] reductase|nr:SDR family oxidoreductase [Nitrospinaceae bacterium]MBT3433787.1 SDR family oxidoreductase [Nitrospinaceae bacterium]MBT3820977.1 SDR family oxidoreductase [Nitrospinaceae bacterium]MBT4092952.1 SDR family oxidoreductase [Nitrospinaceae bacterium]MBT4429308.1 SDR family oxidoreductase [Nitrospinaceae bacterium]